MREEQKDLKIYNIMLGNIKIFANFMFELKKKLFCFYQICVIDTLKFNHLFRNLFNNNLL